MITIHYAQIINVLPEISIDFNSTENQDSKIVKALLVLEK